MYMNRQLYIIDHKGPLYGVPLYLVFSRVAQKVFLFG